MKIDKIKCTGCDTCVNRCPKYAIKIVEDVYGFSYPSIDNKKCIECGLCEKVCHLSQDLFYHNYKGKAYAVINNDERIQNLSSSAGAFSIISSYVIEKGGVVFGAAWGDKYSIKHIKVDSKEGLKLLRRSKYIQSILGTTYRDVKEEIELGKLVLFSGTPCQVAGLKGYLGKEYNNLFLIDVACHGVPSSHIYRMFLDFEEKKKHRIIDNLDFRFKIKDKASYITAIKYKMLGLKFTQYEPWFGTSYGYYFMNGEILRESCFYCKYADHNRVGDITLGDFWGVNEIFPNINERNGVGLVLTNTEKGESFLNAVSSKLTLLECERDEAVCRNPQMMKPTVKPSDREYVLDQIKKNSYMLVDKHYYNSITKDLLIKRIRFKISIFVFNVMKKLRIR